MATTSRKRCTTTSLLIAFIWLSTTVPAAEAGDVNYRDVIEDRNSADSYLSRYFRRLYRRQRNCEEPGLTERVRMADVVLTGTIRGLEADPHKPDSQIARVEVKRVIKEDGQVGNLT